MEERPSRGKKRPLISAESFELAEENVEQVHFELSADDYGTANATDAAEDTSYGQTETDDGNAEVQIAEEFNSEDVGAEETETSHGEPEVAEPIAEESHVEIFDGTQRATEDYEGDEAYVYNANAFFDKDMNGIESAVYKKGGIAHFIRGSIIVRFIRALFLAIAHSIRTSAIINFITGNERIKTAFRGSAFIEFFKSNRVSMALLRFKRKVIRQQAQSSILSGRQELGTNMLRTPVRYYAVFLIALGLSTVGLYYGNLYYIGYYFKLSVYQPYVGAVLFVLGCAALAYSGTLAGLIRASNILKLILFRFFGGSIKLEDETPLDVSYSKIAVLGVGIGIFSLFVPLYQIIIALALFIGAVVILKSPETGVLLIIVFLCFLPFQYACALILAVWISFILKFFSGKRVLSYEYIDIFPLIIMLIFFLGGAVSLGETKISALLPAALCSLYFLVAGLIRDPVWAGRCRVTFIICGVISSATILLRMLPGNPLGLDMILYSSSDQGGSMDSVVQNSGILTMLLAMVFFLQLANFYSRKSKAERLWHFLLCAFFVAALVFLYDIRSMLLFAALLLFAVIVLLKGLRFLIPIATVGVLIMPIFGMPSLTELWNELISNIAGRVSLWQESTQMLFTQHDQVSWFGIGMRQDAAEQLYTGELSYGGTGSLWLWLVIALGIPTTVFLFIVTCIIYNYCLAHGHRCTDKSTPSRLHTYGGLFAISYMLFMGLTENVWYNYRGAAFFWLVLGFTVSVQRYSVGDVSQGYESDHAIIPEI